MFLDLLEEEKGEFPFQNRAREKAKELSFPTRKNEAFRYINLKDLEKGAFTFSKGKYSISVSSDKVELLSLAEAMDKYGIGVSNRLEKSWNESFFSLVNKGWGEDAYCLFIKDSVDEVIEIKESFCGDDQMVCPMLQFFIGSGVKATFHHQIEIAGKGNVLNRSVETAIEKGAFVTFYETSKSSFDNTLLLHTSATIKGEGNYIHRSATTGCKIYRNEIKTYLLERHASCSLEGFWNGNKSDSIHHLIHCSHLAEETNSRQHYQGVSDDKARSSFEGQIYVDKIAQKTDSYQLSKHLLIGEEARGFSKPNLEVFADDVIASHGATVSCLNEEELFYLTSRGIKKADAAILLKRGFLSFFLDQIEDKMVWESFKELTRV